MSLKPLGSNNMATVGMIGLGLMGMPMAQNLIAAGHLVIGYRRGQMSAFAKIGGKPVGSVREVADHAEVILSCIPNDLALEEVVSGKTGLASGDCSGRVLVELSTLSEATKTKQAAILTEKGGVMLDGAISGLPQMVTARTALYFISGDKDTFITARPVLNEVTEKLHFMGAFGNASKTKLCANMLVAINIASTAEMLAFGAKQGLELNSLVDALKESAATSLQFNARAGRMVSGDWEQVLGATSVLTKDIQIISDAARAVGCPVPILSGVADLYDAAIADGQGEYDVAAIYATIAKAAGLDIPGKENL